MMNARGRHKGYAPSADAFRSWARRHAYSFFSSIGALVRRPVSSVLTISVLSLTLTLPIALYLGVDQIQSVVASIDRQQSLSVFLDEDVDEAQAVRLASSVAIDEGVMAVDPISPEVGLVEFLGFLGVTDFEISDTSNPLPWVLEVVPAPKVDLANLTDRLAKHESVVQVMVDLAWLERLDELIEIGLRLAFMIGALMLLAVFAVVANATRVEVQQRRHEIEVMALVGATPSFIRRPFLYSGFWVGSLSAVCSLALIEVASLLIKDSVLKLQQSYQIPLNLADMSAVSMSILIILMGLMGVAGSAVSVAHQLKGTWPAP